MTSPVGGAPPLRQPVIFDQRWCELTFLHWPVDPQQVKPLFPPGTRPDEFDGRTYVALVPFVMRAAAVRPGRPVPYFGDFFETNVRLYSVDNRGRHGVLFRSLDASRLAIVPFARTVFGIPYAWSRMRVNRTGDVISYECRRRLPGGPLRSRVSVRIGASIEATELERWLTDRWGAHSRVAGRTIWVPNQHEPWPLHSAEVLDLDDDLVPASGVRTAGALLRPLWSPGVHAQFGRPTRIE